MNSNNEFNYDIKKQIAVLSDNNGYTVELNLISYRGASPKLDLRKWNRKKRHNAKGHNPNNRRGHSPKRRIRELFKRGVIEIWQAKKHF